MDENRKGKVLNVKESIGRAVVTKSSFPIWKLESEGKEYTWTNKMERVNLIRKGVPYGSIEVISKRIDVPIKKMLHLFGLPQTTYNKKRREQSLLNGRDSEIVLILTELVDYGIEVFNNDKIKFQRWLKKSNASLGGSTPESLLDSITGIQEVENCLNRIEYGNFA
ncbi:antitoxin Xre/MbcA/ParS toxin-binding domain-containing protein [Flavobacterium sp. SUN046]|uniref:type II RES/Xre toxin-antitoxin system antitoxin n=1 Tax=Flavobacterium sp. SUN046 TaxID=3002440 RepID=UPI002DBD6F4D|nr:antitoxin Xre/MbcA/ParS toxin-binding domain-containing protein [Flavobacterium sp. SUN046]MEC4048895.1 antitoxin Xre/MbcA/ParS toxin-binding domain-containing protein [Flavobacterium sp. SUN046]